MSTNSSAEVTGADASVRAEPDQVVECAVGEGPSAPRPALENVLSDSEFEGPIENPDWKERVDLPGSGANLVAPSAVYASLGDDLTSAVRISREQSDSRPADLILEQSLGAHDVTWSQQLSVKARLRVNGQSPQRWERGPDGHQLEHDDLFAALKAGQPYNEGDFGASSTMTAILGRMATYSGRIVRVDHANVLRCFGVHEIGVFLIVLRDDCDPLGDVDAFISRQLPVVVRPAALGAVFVVTA